MRRPRWVIDRLAMGRCLQRCDLDREFGVSAATAKRDFRGLQVAGWIELDGLGKASFYRLTDGARQAQARASRTATEGCGSPASTKAVR